MKKFILTEEARNGFLAYLQERPYKEVAQGIAALLALEELKEDNAVDS